MGSGWGKYENYSIRFQFFQCMIFRVIANVHFWMKWYHKSFTTAYMLNSQPKSKLSMAYGEAFERKYKKLAGSSSLIDKCMGVFGLIRQKSITIAMQTIPIGFALSRVATSNKKSEINLNFFLAWRIWSKLILNHKSVLPPLTTSWCISHPAIWIMLFSRTMKLTHRNKNTDVNCDESKR